jgi:DNA repair photolyase
MEWKTKALSFMLKVTEVQAKSVLNKSKIYDYCVNAYTGCTVNCAYCYARLFMRRYSGHSEPWGSFVDVKINAPELLGKQLERARLGTVWISSVCDAYQRLEATYKLTRRCLEELLKKQFPVNIQTKSALVQRDLDLFIQFKDIDVGFTITTEDERISRLFERGASPVRERVEALAQIHARGVRTFVFVGPLLPGNPTRLAELLQGKVDRVLIDRMNYIYTMRRFYEHQGLSDALTDRFFEEQKATLVSELAKRDIPYQVLF